MMNPSDEYVNAKFPAESEIETPFLRANQIWDERIGSARAQAYSWRLFAFVSLFLAAFMGAALVWKSTKASVLPYIVEVGDAGEVRLVGTPTTQEWRPSEAVERVMLMDWLSNVRSISSDGVVVKANLLKAYDGVTSRAAGILDELISESNPFNQLDKTTRTIEISSMVKVSDSSWRIEWEEAEHDRQGKRFSRIKMMGVFQLVHKMPANKEELEKNPIGLFVEHFSLSKVGGNNE